MAKLTQEELSKITDILSPLDKDPIRNETLNPMAKVLRRIKGIPEIIQENEVLENVPSSQEPDGGIELDKDSVAQADLSTPPQMKYFEEDDVDINELLSDASDLIAGQPLPSNKTAPKETQPIEEKEEPVNDDSFTDTTGTEIANDPFDAVSSSSETEPVDSLEQDINSTTDVDPFSENLDSGEPTNVDSFNDTDATTMDSSTSEEPFSDLASSDDPFGDLGNAFKKDTAPNAMDTDPFADVVPADTSIEEDPFAAISSEPSAEDDPFAEIGGEEEPEVFIPEQEDDPFAEIGGEKPEVTTTAQEDDPFAEIGGEKPEVTTTAQEDDPFAEIGEDSPEITDAPISSDADTFGQDFDTIDSENFGDSNDITGFDDAAATDSDMSTSLGSIESAVDSSSSFESSGVDDDPFADLQQSTKLGHDEFDTDVSSEDYGSGFDDLGGGIGDDTGDTSGSLDLIDDAGQPTESSYDNLEEDLDSLAQEEEPEPELSDEELAIIQQEILKYPPKLKRIVIDVITNDKLPKNEQRELVELIKAAQKPEDIASYLTEKLGYEVELVDKTGAYSERGIPVISTKPIYTKEGELRRRQLIKRTALITVGSIVLIAGLISTYKYIIRPFQAARHYKEGIEYINKAGLAKDSTERTKSLADAKASFAKGEAIEPNSIEYLNKFGIAYSRIGEYDQAFEKLFGTVEPDFGAEPKGEMESWTKRLEVPYIQLSSKTPWDNDRLPLGGRVVPENEYMVLVSGTGKKKVERKIKAAGAYIVARLEKNIHDNETYINLGNFHSNIANLFSKPNLGRSRNFKNDNLAIAYFKEVFTDGEDENNVEATDGLAKIYYHQKKFARSVFYYNKIVEKFPDNAIGHGGLLSNYIEMWKLDQNPQFVLNHHRQVRNALGIEKDLSLFVLTKLAAFYIDLNASEVRIKYNINPEDQVTNMDLEDNIEHLLNIAFFKSEKGKDGEEVKGDEFAEGYYQRGRYLINKGESIQALKQFEFASSYDPAHYLAVMEMAEHYMRLNNYSESIELLKNAENRYDHYKDFYGNKEEDETLLNGDHGRIYFNKGKIAYMESALISKDGKMTEFPDRKVYPDKSLSQLSEEESNRRKNLNYAMQLFEKALSENLKDPKLRRELFYYKGWIEYMHSDYEAALDEWSNLDEADIYLNSNVMLGRANAFYNLDQLNASLGNYIKIKEDFEEKESVIASPTPEESAHQEIYNVLIAVYNNIGTIYERKGNSAQALTHYWKAIEVARKIGLTSEIATYNKDMVFKTKTNGKLPLLDDWLSPTVDTVKELLNTKKSRL